MTKIAGTLFSIFISFNAFATLYVPVPIEKQLETSSAVIRGVYAGESYAQHPNGKVSTIMSFKVIKQAGVDDVVVSNPHDFKVMLPGGVWNGLVYHVDGIPEFKVGEESILILKKGLNGMWLQDMALGKYNIRNDKIYSTVFPEDERLSNIPMEQFEKMVEEQFGETLRPVVTHTGTTIGSEEQLAVDQEQNVEQRSPASYEKEQETNSIFLAVFLCLTVGVIGGIGCFLTKRD